MANARTSVFSHMLLPGTDASLFFRIPHVQLFVQLSRQCIIAFSARFRLSFRQFRDFVQVGDHGFQKLPIGVAHPPIFPVCRDNRLRRLHLPVRPHSWVTSEV
jgi:hypothetical protein